MEITLANKKKEELEKNINKLLQDFCEESGLQLGEKIEISSFYDQETVKGTYLICLNIKNPFNCG